MITHTLKCDPVPFSHLVTGVKTFEFRRDDRDFKVGDLLEIRETKFASTEFPPALDRQLTGAKQIRKITHILRPPDYGVPEGFCILSLGLLLVKELSPLDTQVGGEPYKKFGTYQPWRVLHNWFSSEELKGAMKKEVIAYLAREAGKGGRQDIEKAHHTLGMYLALTEEEKKK